MVYFAYGALGVIDVTRDFWVKEQLTLSPSELAGIAGLARPAVDGENGVRGARRLRTVVRLATRLLRASRRDFHCSRPDHPCWAAGGWLTFLSRNELYVFGMLLTAIGTVIRTWWLDAIDGGCCAHGPRGVPRPEHDVRADLGMVQVLGRLALSAGILAVAGLSGWIASMVSREAGFLIGLVVPVISVTGIVIRRKTPAERRPIDWRILGGGISVRCDRDRGWTWRRALRARGDFSDLDGGGVHHAGVGHADACTRNATRDLLHQHHHLRVSRGAIRRRRYYWWTIDVLKFDPSFQGMLRQIGAVIGIAALWMFSKQITDYSVTKVMLWITIAGTILTIPSISLLFGLQNWTKEMFGFGARSIAIIDAAAVSPFAQLSVVPMLTLIAYYAPEGQRATWFALMASLMNLALTAGSLETKYLNDIFPVDRGQYAELVPLYLWVVAIGFVLPIAAIVLFGKRIVRT